MIKFIMAEDLVADELVMVCPFYLHSSCLNGDNCQFAHEITKILPEDVMCEFFLRGMCKYGDKCWFSHGLPKNKTKCNANSRDENISDFSESSEKSKKDTQNQIKMRYCFRHRSAPKVNPDPPFRSEISDIINEMRKSYADTLKESNRTVPKSANAKLPMDMCVHFELGKCPLGDLCPCLHGNLCELCRKYCLHPYSTALQRSHIEECEKELERDMKLSFAIQCSKDKVCGICLEVVLEKDKHILRRFGILEKCSHVFCLSCIREWRRQRKSQEILQPESIVDHRVMRACPQCRVQSDFITPSKYWFESEEEKKKLVDNYKQILKTKHCKYFKRGEGTCPFGAYCFYLHSMLDGTVVELPVPTRRRRQNQDEEVELFDQLVLFDYLEERGENILRQHLHRYIGDDESGENYLV